MDGILTSTVSGGNTGLTPESADTTTVGFAIRGAGVFQGFSSSVDFYDIDLSNAIATLTPQLLVTRCRTQGVYCDLVDFNPNGSVALVRTVFPEPESTARPWPRHRAAIHARGRRRHARLQRARDSHGKACDDGRHGYHDRPGRCDGQQRFRWRCRAAPVEHQQPRDLHERRALLSLEGRYIDDGLFDATLIGPEQDGYNINLPNSVNTNHVASAVYVNLGARYKLPQLAGAGVELFAGVQNLLDRDPPVAPSNQGATNMILFDPLGRSYRAGVRMEF